MKGSALDAHKVAAARLWATARMPYLASAIFASTVVSDPDTIAIDRSWQVHADPSIVEPLTVEQLGRLLVHLSGHAIRDHAARAQQLGVAEDNQRARWNRCADAEINDDLLVDDLVPDLAPDLPSNLKREPGGLGENYYEDARDGPRRWDCGSGSDGCDRPGESKGSIDPQQAQLLRLSVAAEIQREHAREPTASPVAGSAGPSPCCPRGSTGAACSPPRFAAPWPPLPAKWTQLPASLTSRPPEPQRGPSHTPAPDPRRRDCLRHVRLDARAVNLARGC